MILIVGLTAHRLIAVLYGTMSTRAKRKSYDDRRICPNELIESLTVFRGNLHRPVKLTELAKPAETRSKKKHMIDGIGGVFLFSNDTRRLAAWYRDCLGIVPAGEDSECNSIYATFECRDLENPEIKRTIAWAIMRTDQDITDKPRTGQINYRVKNMGEILSHLKSKGVAIEKTAEYPSFGNFAWLRDPDGNKIELWEPSQE